MYFLSFSHVLYLQDQSLPYQITIDNCDRTVKPHVMTEKRQTVQHNWLIAVANQERVGSEHLRLQPKKSIWDVPTSDILPTVEDQEKLRSEYKELVGRVLVKHIPYFTQFTENVQEHIPHEYSSVMAAKTEVIPLGLLEVNEKKPAELLSALKHLNKSYVPTSPGDVSKPAVKVILTGDQLTKQNVDAVLLTMTNDKTPYEKLEGIKAAAADFHCVMNHNDVIQKEFYNPRSSNDLGTMFHLRTKINRRNVTKSALGDNFRACDVFIHDVTDASVITAALDYFNMDSPADSPKKNIPGQFTWLSEKQLWWDQNVFNIIDQYILTDSVDVPSVNKASVVTKDSRKEIKCDYPGCKNTFKNTSQRTKHFKLKHKTDIIDNVGKKGKKKQSSCVDSDGIFSYHSRFLKYALLGRNFQDAISEGDGKRICRLWKFKLLNFRKAGRTKYSLEALKLQLDLQAVLLPADAHRLMWNRTVNTVGGPGQNIALDLNCEHYVRFTKDLISHLGANVKFDIAQDMSRTVGVQKELMESFDKDCLIKAGSGRHTAVNRENDIMSMVDVLHQQKVFHKQPARGPYHHFRQQHVNALHRLDADELEKWIRKHKRIIADNEDRRLTSKEL